MNAGYEAYLRTKHWRRVRYAALKDAGGRCELCGKQAAHVHHLTYERLHHERPGDTQALCGPCHMQQHGKEWIPRNRRITETRTEERDGRTYTVKVYEPRTR